MVSEADFDLDGFVTQKIGRHFWVCGDPVKTRVRVASRCAPYTIFAQQTLAADQNQLSLIRSLECLCRNVWLGPSPKYKFHMSDGVSCLCLTYGRPSLLEEASESFLRQQWDGPKELIVVNDHPKQELVFNHGEVVIVNIKRRIRTLGEKRNLSAALAKYDYLLVWDDDDIHLPWRIAETMKELPERHFFKCPQVWQTNQGIFERKMWRGDFYYHCTAAYSRHLFEQMGGYRCINGGEDLDFEKRIRVSSNVNKYWGVTHLPLERMYYIYRRRHGHYHATGIVDLREIELECQRGSINWSRSGNSIIVRKCHG